MIDELGVDVKLVVVLYDKICLMMVNLKMIDDVFEYLKD